MYDSERVQPMGDQTVHGSIWKRGWFIEHLTHLHHRHVPENATKAEKESVAKSMQHSVTMQKTYVDEEEKW
jgi:hypothetical protein